MLLFVASWGKKPDVTAMKHRYNFIIYTCTGTKKNLTAIYFLAQSLLFVCVCDIIYLPNYNITAVPASGYGSFKSF